MTKPVAKKHKSFRTRLRALSQEVRSILSPPPTSSSATRPLFAIVAFVALATAVIWFYSTESPAADYVPLALLFLSAMAAIRGKSWDDTRQGISRVTLTGFLLFALALLGLVGGIRDTQMSHSRLAGIETIQDIAYRQLMAGISMVLFPITSTWREPPTNDMDIIDMAQDATTIDALQNTRLVPYPNRAEDIMAMMQDTRFFLVSPNGTRVTTRCGAPHQGFRAIYELFDFCVASGDATIREVQQTFIGTLDATTVRLLNDVLDDDFFKSTYSNLAQHEQLFYQGIQEETGENLTGANRTWLALVEVSREMFSDERLDDTAAPTQEPSLWLFLGTYYFGNDSDTQAYRSFIQKVREFVLHVNTVTNRQDLIDTF